MAQINYQQALIANYNAAIKKGKQFVCENDYMIYLLESPSHELFLNAMTKKRGSKSYPVTSIEVYDHSVPLFPKNKILLLSDFQSPITEFIPTKYRVRSKELHNGITIDRDKRVSVEGLNLNRILVEQLHYH